MKQLLQSVRDGSLRVVSAPSSTPGPTEVLVATTCSLVSLGTEKAVHDLASANLLTKAKARPDLVRQVIAKAKADGLRSTRRAVKSRLQDEMPLGYSAAGRVLAVGEAVSGLTPGMRVATASAGHGDHQIVPGLLAVPIPDGVTDSQAAFGAVAAIALQGIRQADTQVGGTVAVIGLGLIGQLTVRIAIASGLNVIGVDLKSNLVDIASTFGATAFVERGGETTRAVLDLTRGRGVDAVLLTAGTKSSMPAMRSASILRDRGRLVVVGDVGLDLERTPFYEKELEIRFARSYGPGRYERPYEDYGVDYPLGHVRWTEGRNIETYLNLVATGRVQVDDLVSRRYPLESAQDAYESLSEDDVIGVQFTYSSLEASPSVSTRSHFKTDPAIPSIGMIGAGNFVQATLLPAFPKVELPLPQMITSAGGTSAARIAQKFDIPIVAPTANDLLQDAGIDTVMIVSSHDSHASLAIKALKAGKHVLLEKPWALTEDELTDLEDAYIDASTVLWPGFNRRYAPAVSLAASVLSAGHGSLSITYRINAGELPASHWYHDRRQGGRLLGEVCHFVDTASWIIGMQPSRAAGMGDGRGETLLQENVTSLLSYPDGSTAAVVYSCNGSPKTPKEQIEILGRGCTIHIDNFSQVTINGQRARLTSHSKGHAENLQAFRKAILSETSREDTVKVAEAAFATTNVMLQIARSLTTGEIIQIDI